MAPKNGQQMQGDPMQQNDLARRMVTANAVERLQQVFNQTVDAQSQSQININPRNVGLIKGFFVKVSAEITAGATDLTLTGFGPSNILSQIKFDDLQNNTRIQTSGWHMHFVNSVRNQRPFGLSETLDTSPIAYGNNWDVISAPTTITATETETVQMYYYIPLSYSNEDLRGALYANVVNATMQLQLTINTAAASAAAQNQAALSVYTATNAGTVGNVSIEVYQHYLDQLPMGPNGPILPILDLSTIYECKNTSMTGISVGQDYPVPYANFRTFLSTLVVFDNGGTLGVGADLNYWALRSANFTDIFKYGPEESALLTRLRIGLDLPDGAYYFDHRSKPLNTVQYGNMELVANASTVNTNARLLVGYEDFAQINIVSGAGSLPAGG